jgi:hypothetical protein
MRPKPPVDAGIGDLLSFEYPERNLIGVRPAWKPRLLLVERVVDTMTDPIDPRAVELVPLTRRGRYLIHGHDLHLERPRSFYYEAMRHIRRNAWLQLALFDPWDEHFTPCCPRGPFAPTRKDREFMAAVIQHYNRKAARRRSIQLNVGVFPVEGRPHASRSRNRPA